MSNLYEILEVEETATMKEIKRAYLNQSKIHHPDKEGGDEDKFKEISEAYRILSDPELRQKYDNGCEITELKEEADGLMRRVFALFEECMTSHGFVPDHTDLFKKMRGKCNELELKMNRDIESVENEIKNVESIQARMKNAEVFERYLDNTKEGKLLRIKQIEKEKGYISQVLNFIANCEYEVDEDEDFNIRRREFKFFPSMSDMTEDREW